MIAFLAFACTSFTACSDDDDDPITTNNGNNGSYGDDDNDDQIRCHSCNGTGICKNCYGTGEVGDRNCGFCGNWNGTCPICAGDGYY